MSERSRLGKCDDEKRAADLCREKCPNTNTTNTSARHLSFKKDSSIGPCGDYEYSISNSTFSLRSAVMRNNSSRNSSGRNDLLDDELYDTSDDYIEKLNLVRRKLNLIEISDSEPSDRSDDIKERCNHQISTLFEVEDETESSVELEINKFGHLDQITQIVGDIKPLTKFDDESDDYDESERKSIEVCDSYYEISDKEIRKKGTQSWSVNLVTFNTTENEHPPKKKLCTRVATPVLTAKSDNYPQFQLHSVDEAELFSDDKGTQFRTKDIGEGAEEAPSIIDIDKSIGCTQVELESSSTSSYSSEDTSQSNLHHIIPNVIIRSGSSSLSSTDTSPSPTPNPDLIIKTQGSLPPDPQKGSLQQGSPELEPEPELELLHFTGNHPELHLNLASLGSSSNTNTNTASSAYSEKTLKQDADMRALRSLNGPDDEEQLQDEFLPVDSHVTVIENKKGRSFKSKLLSLQANVTGILNPEQSVKKIPYKELIAAMGDDKIPSRNSSALINRLSKLNRPKSSSSSSRESFPANFRPIIESSMMRTVDLDVPRIATKKYSFPAISYLTGPLHDHRLLQEDDLDSDKFMTDIYGKYASDCYREAARTVLEEKSSLNIASKKSVVNKSAVTILPENCYTIHKKQSSGEDFYAVAAASSDEELNQKDPEMETVLLSPAVEIASSRCIVKRAAGELNGARKERRRRRCGRWRRFCGCFGYLFESRESEFF